MATHSQSRNVENSIKKARNWKTSLPWGNVGKEKDVLELGSIIDSISV